MHNSTVRNNQMQARTEPNVLGDLIYQIITPINSIEVFLGFKRISSLLEPRTHILAAP